MPIFEFVCNNCDKVFEVIHVGSKDSSDACPFCESTDIKKVDISGFNSFIINGYSSKNNYSNKCDNCESGACNVKKKQE